jgi:hypothetical protein
LSNDAWNWPFFYWNCCDLPIYNIQVLHNQFQNMSPEFCQTPDLRTGSHCLPTSRKRVSSDKGPVIQFKCNEKKLTEISDFFDEKNVTDPSQLIDHMRLEVRQLQVNFNFIFNPESAASLPPVTNTRAATL